MTSPRGLSAGTSTQNLDEPPLDRAWLFRTEDGIRSYTSPARGQAATIGEIPWLAMVQVIEKATSGGPAVRTYPSHA